MILVVEEHGQENQEERNSDVVRGEPESGLDEDDQENGLVFLVEVDGQSEGQHSQQVVDSGEPHHDMVLLVVEAEDQKHLIADEGEVDQQKGYLEQDSQCFAVVFQGLLKGAYPLEEVDACNHVDCYQKSL